MDVAYSCVTFGIDISPTQLMSEPLKHMYRGNAATNHLP